MNTQTHGQMDTNTWSDGHRHGQMDTQTSGQMDTDTMTLTLNTAIQYPVSCENIGLRCSTSNNTYMLTVSVHTKGVYFTA